MKNTIEKISLNDAFSYSAKMQSICTDLAETCICRKHEVFILFGDIGRHWKSRNKRKEMQLYISYNFKVCSEGWTLSQWNEHYSDEG